MEAEIPDLATILMEYQFKAKDVLAAAFMPDWQYGGASKELQAIFMLDHRTVEHEQRITALEESMVVDYSQQRTLAAQVNAAVVGALGAALEHLLTTIKTFEDVHTANAIGISRIGSGLTAGTTSRASDLTKLLITPSAGGPAPTCR